jgi:uncharacterized protein
MQGGSTQGQPHPVKPRQDGRGRHSGGERGRAGGSAVTVDLAGLRLSAGEGRKLALGVPIEPLLLGSERYAAEPTQVPVELGVSRMTGGGYALLLRFGAAASGPCMRCLQPAAPMIEVEAREVHMAGGGDELESPYVEGETLDLGAWTRDAFALAMPAKVLCREDCAGLCPVCAADLNQAGPEHRHEAAPDPRWAKLSELLGE